MVTVIVSILLGVVFVLIPYLFQAGGEGRYRRGVGWYLDVRSSRQTLLKERPEGIEPHTEGAPPRSIHLWLTTGIGLLALALVTWVPFGIYGLSIIFGLFGVVYVLRAIGAWRENRWLRGPDRRRNPCPRS
jgi:hypothetical protein